VIICFKDVGCIHRNDGISVTASQSSLKTFNFGLWRSNLENLIGSLANGIAHLNIKYAYLINFVISCE